MTTKKSESELREIAIKFEDECMPNGTMGTGRGAALRRTVTKPDRPTINPQCGSQGLDDDGHCARCGLIPIMGDHCPPGFLDPNVEMIIRAAIRYKDRVWSTTPPNRHHHVIQKMIGAGLPSESCVLPNQGFLTSTGRFVNRSEAAKIARSAGQLWRTPTPEWMLSSEDVW